MVEKPIRNLSEISFKQKFYTMGDRLQLEENVQLLLLIQELCK